MPYHDYICAACGTKQNRYHNVRDCKKCGKKCLVMDDPFAFSSARMLREENHTLRKEVNELRKRKKYQTMGKL